MAQRIEVIVRVRYNKMMADGSVKKVAEIYLVDALSCTEAEAIVTEALTPYISGDFRISSVVTTNIAETKFVDACAEGGVESVTMTATVGRTVHSAILNETPKGQPA